MSEPKTRGNKGRFCVEEQVIKKVEMQDTLKKNRPSVAFSSSRQVCDDSCGDGVYGDYNCDWRGLGPKCRFCFDDLEAALMADEVARSHGGRVMMCST